MLLDSGRLYSRVLLVTLLTLLGMFLWSDGAKAQGYGNPPPITMSGNPSPPTYVPVGEIYYVTVSATNPNGAMSWVGIMPQTSNTPNYPGPPSSMPPIPYTYYGSQVGPTIVHTFTVVNQEPVYVWWDGFGGYPGTDPTAGQFNLAIFGFGYFNSMGDP